jgi:hypothetical protein
VFPAREKGGKETSRGVSSEGKGRGLRFPRRNKTPGTFRHINQPKWSDRGREKFPVRGTERGGLRGSPSETEPTQFDSSPCVDSAESQRTARGGISGRIGLDSGLLYVSREVWVRSDVPLTDSLRETFLVEKSCRRSLAKARWITPVGTLGTCVFGSALGLSSTRDNQVNTEV